MIPRRHPSRHSDRPGSRPALGAAGWIIGLALLFVTAAVSWRVYDILGSRGRRAVGDGRDPATYGFDLSAFTGDRGQLAASGLPRDGIPVLDFPRLWTVARVDSLAHAGRRKYLVSGDRVIGVTQNGRARAYPLMILNWHEVANDTLGGMPVAVTYSPLCDAAVVFRRDTATPGEPPMLLGHSGLLYNSGALLYDRQSGHRGESLFHQLTGRPMAGPAAARGDSLEVLSCALVRWADWKTRYPETTVLWRDPARAEAYKRDPYLSYLGDDRLRFPVAPLPPDNRWPRKTPCLVLGAGATSAVLPLPLLASRVDQDGVWRTTWQGTPLVFHWREAPPTAWVESGDGDAGGQRGTAPAVRYACWFSCFAMQDGRVRILN